MKKATNSKNRVKFSKLFPIMQEHFGQSMNLARIKLMALLLEALVKAQTVNLVRLANVFPSGSEITIKRAKQKVKIVQIPHHNFAHTLRHKLLWGK